MRRSIIAIIAIGLLFYVAYARIQEVRQARKLDLAIAIQEDNVQDVRNHFPWTMSVNGIVEDGSTPLQLAASDRSLDVARFLISKGANVNAKDAKLGGTALHWSTVGSENQRKALDMAKLLVQHGADVNARDKDGLTPLHSALLNGSYDVADLLISNGADLTIKDNQGWTPLHYANNLDYANKLIRRGAKIDNIYDASWFGRIDAVKSFLAADPKLINAKSSEGMTPIFYAVGRNALDVAQLLISKGARLDVRDSDGRTPLFLARTRQAIELLAADGADVNAKDTKNRTAYYYAKLCDDEKTANGLIAAGAKIQGIKLPEEYRPEADYGHFANPRVIKLLQDCGYLRKDYLRR